MAHHSQARDTELIARVRRYIDEERLPVFFPDKIGAAYGSGWECDACGTPITRSQVEYTFDGFSLCLHLHCYVIWQMECAARIEHQLQGSESRVLQ